MTTTKRCSIFAAASVALAALALPSGSEGQVRDAQTREDFAFGPPKGEFFFHGDLMMPVGEFDRRIDLGGGAGMGGVLFLDESGTVGLRVGGTFAIYGVETVEIPVLPRVTAAVRTTNYVASAGAGPQLYIGYGAVRPYVYATVGFAYFATESSLRDADDWGAADNFLSTTNFDDFGLALTGGGGLSVRLSGPGSKNPVSLDLSATYQHNGQNEYLTKGDIEDLPGNQWTVSPNLSDTNFVMYRAGLSVGLR